MTNRRAMFVFNDWRIIRTNPANLTIERKVDGAWQFYGYYGAFGNALNALVDKVGFNANTLDDAVRELREIRHAIERLIKE